MNLGRSGDGPLTYTRKPYGLVADEVYKVHSYDMWMQAFSKNRVIIAVLSGAAAILFLAVVELGISAGRIHRGVDVNGIDVGGLTLPDAEDLLAEQGKALRQRSIAFTAEGTNCNFAPKMLGWRPEPEATAENALGVGRAGGLGSALLDRLKAWTGGVSVGWAGTPKLRKVARFVDDCVERGAAVGVEVHAGNLRFLVRRAIVTPDRQIFDIPLIEEVS
jgi:hypothetical protein